MKNLNGQAEQPIHQSMVLQQVTLIIPTFNRPQFLARLLQYYAIKATPIHFLILDSSSDEQTRISNSKACGTLGSNARYLNFASSIPVATKLLEGLKLVDTEFCAFCADDDLVFIEGLEQALLFLQANPDYVCADGIYLNFYPVKNDIHLTVEYASKGIAAEDPGARVFRLFQKYESLFYGVFKTQHAQHIFSGVSKNSSLHYQELFQATAALLLGKSHRLPVFYAARQHCDPADRQRDKWQTYYWFADNPSEFLEHYLVYRDELWDFYQAHAKDVKLSKELFIKTMDIAHAMYFGIGCPPEYFHTVLQDKSPIGVFRKADEAEDNVCNLLKSTRRVAFEINAEKFLIWLSKRVGNVYSIRAVKGLNRHVQARSKHKWNCKLSSELRWLASVNAFRHAYQELCQYMSHV